MCPSVIFFVPPYSVYRNVDRVEPNVGSFLSCTLPREHGGINIVY